MKHGDWYQVRLEDEDEPITFQLDRVYQGYAYFRRTQGYSGDREEFKMLEVIELKPVKPPYEPKDRDFILSAETGYWRVRLSGKWYPIACKNLSKIYVLEDQFVLSGIAEGEYEVHSEAYFVACIQGLSS